MKEGLPGASVDLGAASDVAPLRFAAEAMNAVFEVICHHPDPRYAEQAAHAAFDEVRRLEQDLSRFRSNSDVSRVSALGAGGTTRVSPSSMECLALAHVVFALTGGAFDVSLGSGLETLSLDPESLGVHVGGDGLRLDLGGIGKGYAVDRMAEILSEWGIEAALVHGGSSSVRALEPPPGTGGWPLTLRAPAPDGAAVLARFEARRLALSASGTGKGDHIVDPRTGRAVRDRAAWVALPVRPRAVEAGAGDGWPDLDRSPATVAEGLSTAFMILSQNEIATLCARAPGVEAWLCEGASTGGPGALHHWGGSAPPPPGGEPS